MGDISLEEQSRLMKQGEDLKIYLMKMNRNDRRRAIALIKQEINALKKSQVS